jgi:nitroreductase
MTNDFLPPNTSLEHERLLLERARFRTDIIKWIIVAAGAVISFAVIDYGKLTLEQFKADAENQRELLNAYLKATESPEPDVWKRKLHLIISSTNNTNTVAWATKELEYIDKFAALNALYRETLKVAAQLVEPQNLTTPERIQARARYNQLYWADLPYAGESQSVISAMIAFRKQLILAENAGTDPAGKAEWEKLNINLINLSKALRESTPTR